MGPISPGTTNNNKRFLPVNKCNSTFVQTQTARVSFKKQRKGSVDQLSVSQNDSSLVNDHDYFVNDSMSTKPNCDEQLSLSGTESIVESNEMDVSNNSESGNSFRDSSNIIMADIEKLPSDNNICNHSQQTNSNTDNANVIDRSTTEVKSQESYRYVDSDPAPYIVFIESINGSGNIGNIHPMSLGRKLVANNVKGVAELRKVGRNRLKCLFDSVKSTNDFLNSSFSSQNNVKSYIPSYQVQRQGLVRDVDPSITEAEIMNYLSKSVDVLSIRRLTKRVVDTDGQSTYVPIPLIVITFKGKCLPTYVNLYFTRCTVEPYVRLPVQCYNCLRYGHTAKACRSRTRCGNCTLEHNSQNCPNSSSPSCFFCKGSHSALNRECPQRNIEESISRYMAYENISYNEAKAIVSPTLEKSQVKGYTYAQSLKVTKEQFPYLPSKENLTLKEKFCVTPSISAFSQTSPSNLQLRNKHNYRQYSTKSKSNVTQSSPRFTNNYYSQFEPHVYPSSPVYGKIQNNSPNGEVPYTKIKDDDNVLSHNEDVIEILKEFKYGNLPITSLIPALYNIIVSTQKVSLDQTPPYNEHDNVTVGQLQTVQ